MSIFSDFVEVINSQLESIYVDHTAYYEGIDAAWDAWNTGTLVSNPYTRDDEEWKYFQKGVRDGSGQIETAEAFAPPKISSMV